MSGAEKEVGDAEAGAPIAAEDSGQAPSPSQNTGGRSGHGAPEVGDGDGPTDLPSGDGPQEPQAPAEPRVLFVAGSRGGAGSSMIAANLALFFATIGRRVVLVDADPGGRSLHTFMGVKAPEAMGRDLEASRAPSPFHGLSLLAAGFDEPAGPAPRADRLPRLLERVRTLAADIVIIDPGVGLSREFLDAYLDADVALLVVSADPAGVEGAYRLMRGAFARHVLSAPELGAELRTSLESVLREMGGAPSPLDLARRLDGLSHPAAPLVRASLKQFSPRIVINQSRLRADLELGYSMHSAARRRLGIELDYLGHIDHDETVWSCVRNRKPVLLDVPGAKSSKKIEKLARRLLMVLSGKRVRKSSAPPPDVPRDTHHDLLELDRGATEEEVRRAYKRGREIFAHDALCCYGLLEPSEIEKLRASLDEAFDVLLDPARRRPYELSMFPDEPPRTRVAVEDDMDEPGRPMPELSPDTEFTGALLREVREAKRVSLRDISQRTKIGVPYLRAIEREAYGELPAPVYVAGFVTEVARYLRVDPQQASRSYVRRMKTGKVDAQEQRQPRPR